MIHQCYTWEDPSVSPPIGDGDKTTLKHSFSQGQCKGLVQDHRVPKQVPWNPLQGHRGTVVLCHMATVAANGK